MRFLFLIFFFPLLIFSQTGKVTYYVTPELKKNAKTEAINEEIDLMRFTLKYNETVSFFSKEKSIPKDKMLSNIALIHLQSYFPWYQNRLKREVVHNKEIKGKMYLVDHDYKFGDWKLLNNNKVIDGYTCYEAEKKEFNERSGKYRLVSAWYTPDIPFPYGPIGYGGLPGLILQLRRAEKGTYTAEKIKLNSKKLKIPVPESGKKIKVEEFVKLMIKARKVTVD